MGDIDVLTYQEISGENPVVPVQNMNDLKKNAHTAEVMFDSICFIEVSVQQQMDRKRRPFSLRSRRERNWPPIFLLLPSALT